MEEKLKNNSILKTILIMGLPPIISMLIQSLYSIVDGIFVAGVSDNAFNAISYAYPITNLTLSLAVGFGVGLNSVISRALGANDLERVKRTTDHFFVFSFVHYFIFILLGLTLTPFFFGFFTDNKEIIEDGKLYLNILLFTCIGQLLHIAIEKIFQAYGKMLIPMIAQGLGCIVNIVLDAIMIYVFKWGIMGAAIATVIGQFSSFIYIFIMALKYKYISFNKDIFKLNRIIIKDIYRVGIPSTIMSALVSILTLILNFILKNYGDDYVQILGAYFKLQAFIYMPANGMIQGIRPIFGFLYGEGNSKKLHEAIKGGILIMLVFTLIGTILFLVIPKYLMMPFANKNEVVTNGAIALRIICIGFIPSSLSLVFMALYESIGYGKESLIISLSRQLILPILYIMIGIYAFKGDYLEVWISFPFAEVLTTLVSFLIYKLTLKKDEILSL